VIEDEFLVRINTVDILQSAGYRTLEASNADEAIAILESRNDIEIVFTDINMPGSMDGLKLAHAIRGRWPPIKLIVTSGRRVLAGDEIPSGARFLPKPYDQRVLIDTLKKLAA
jgi:CheY-like chemotaxis protein